MCLEPADHMVWMERTESLSTQKLHELDLYWRENSDNTIDEQLHRFVELELQSRGEKTLRQIRKERIETLNKSFSLSHPLGRLLVQAKSLLASTRND